MTKPRKEEKLAFKKLKAAVEELLAQVNRVRFQVSEFRWTEVLRHVIDVTT